MTNGNGNGVLKTLATLVGMGITLVMVGVAYGSWTTKIGMLEKQAEAQQVRIQSLEDFRHATDLSLQEIKGDISRIQTSIEDISKWMRMPVAERRSNASVP